MELKIILMDAFRMPEELVFCDYIENDHGELRCMCWGQEQPVRILPADGFYQIRWNREDDVPRS